MPPEPTASEAEPGGSSLPRSAATWRPDPAVVAWVGLVAVALLLAVYSVAAPQSQAVLLTGSPFDAPVLLHRLGPPD